MRFPLFASLLIATLIAASCSGDSDPSDSAADTQSDDPAEPDDVDVPEPDPDPEPEPEPDSDATTVATFNTRASGGQVMITGADAGSTVELRSDTGASIQSAEVDDLGNLIFRRVAPAAGYVVADISADPVAVSEPFDLAADDEHPDAEFYESQTLVEGLNYIEMRDGTTLAATVRFPDGAGDGPFPTVVEYSGYDPADPDEEEPTIGIYRQLGYATVGVNMRGSGCSGGAFSFFDPVQSIDGYDVIEAVAAQDWVEFGHVGMVGISYSGISQLFVAATQPPNLAAITAISVIEDTYRSTLYPGGIYNNGFAKSWADSRQGSNEAYGQEWVEREVADGDASCDANQLLRSQNNDLDQLSADNRFYDPSFMDALSPRTFIDRIDVPVFLAGAWQDEQTGGRFATMLDNFTNAPVLKVQLYNGAHADSLGPESLFSAVEFLDVYVARRTPILSPFMRLGASLLYGAVFGTEGLTIPEDRFTSLEEAKEVIESELPVRILLEMGSNPDALGGPAPRTELAVASWPPPAAVATTFLLGAGGSLSDSGVAAAGFESFIVNEARSQELTKTADETADGERDANEFDNLAWSALADTEALVYDTERFDEDVLLAGSGSVKLWLAADHDDADLQVTISEIRPDGQEMYVQSGWLRASHRASDTGAVDPDEIHTHLEADFTPLPPGEFTEVDVEIFPAAHIFRAGSRLRLTVDSPGATRNLWAFDVVAADGGDIILSLGDDTPSAVTLPLMTGLGADVIAPGLPTCGATRSQPCRPAADWVNQNAALG